MTEPQQPTPPPVAWPVQKPASNAPYVAIGIGIGAVVILPVIVAIIGILAAIAIPNFVRYGLRAKTSEAKVNVRQLAVAEAVSFADHGRYVAVPPTAAPERGQATPFRGNEGTTALAFDPGPTVRYSYEVEVVPGTGRAIVRARGDVDADGVEAEYRIELSRGVIGQLQEPEPGIF